MQGLLQNDSRYLLKPLSEFTKDFRQRKNVEFKHLRITATGVFKI